MMGLNAFLLLAFLGLLARDHHEKLLRPSYKTDYENILVGVREIQLTLDARTDFSSLKACREEKAALWGAFKRLLAPSGLAAAEEGGDARLRFDIRCSGQGSFEIRRIRIYKGGDRWDLPLYSPAEGYARLLESAGPSVILPALKDEDARIQDAAVQAIGAYKAQWAIDPLLEFLSEKKGRMLNMTDAYEHLGNIVLANRTQENVDKVLPALFEGLANGNWGKTKLIWILGELRDQRAIGPLILELKDNCLDGHAAEKALRTIDPEWRSSEGARKAAAAWLADMGSGGKEEKRRAVAGLGHIGGEEAFQALLSALRDKSFPGRDDVAMALGNIGDPRAVPPLVATLSLPDEDGQVAFQAKRSLGRLTQQGFGEDTAKWLDWWERNRAGYE